MREAVTIDLKEDSDLKNADITVTLTPSKMTGDLWTEFQLTTDYLAQPTLRLSLGAVQRNVGK